jgi:hypothetical protein
VQKRLADELGVRLTYMEVRFLLADLDLKPRDVDPPASAGLTPNGAAVTPPAASGADDPGATPAPDSGSQVRVTVDQLTRPGAVVSGRVTFSDGQTAEWYLDQMGRLGLAAKEKGYRPPQSDLMEFQNALQNELAKLGF